MKKRLLLITALFCMVIAMPSAQAQLRYGIKAGLNYSKANVKNGEYSMKSSAGYFIGPMMEVTIPYVGIGLDGALLLSQRKVKGDNMDTYNQESIDIPVNLKWTAGLSDLAGIYVAAGPEFIYSIGSGEKLYDIDFSQKKAQVAINIGAGVRLLNHLQLGANYNMPVNKSADSRETDASYKLNNWQVSLVYLF